MHKHQPREILIIGELFTRCNNSTAQKETEMIIDIEQIKVKVNGRTKESMRIRREHRI